MTVPERSMSVFDRLRPFYDQKSSEEPEKKETGFKISRRAIVTVPIKKIAYRSLTVSYRPSPCPS